MSSCRVVLTWAAAIDALVRRLPPARLKSPLCVLMVPTRPGMIDQLTLGVVVTVWTSDDASAKRFALVARSLSKRWPN